MVAEEFSHQEDPPASQRPGQRNQVHHQAVQHRRKGNEDRHHQMQNQTVKVHQSGRPNPVMPDDLFCCQPVSVFGTPSDRVHVHELGETGYHLRNQLSFAVGYLSEVDHSLRLLRKQGRKTVL